MKAKKQMTIALYGMEGYGATKTEATADAARKLCAATEGYYEPRMVRFPAGNIGLVYRDLRGWNYAIMWPDCAQIDSWHTGEYASRQEADRAMRRHIAQNLLFVVEDNGMSVILEERDQREHAEYIAWQLRYRALREAGYGDQEAHALSWSAQTAAEAIAKKQAA